MCLHLNRNMLIIRLQCSSCIILTTVFIISLSLLQHHPIRTEARKIVFGSLILLFKCISISNLIAFLYKYTKQFSIWPSINRISYISFYLKWFCLRRFLHIFVTRKNYSDHTTRKPSKILLILSISWEKSFWMHPERI